MFSAARAACNYKVCVEGCDGVGGSSSRKVRCGGRGVLAGWGAVVRSYSTVGSIRNWREGFRYMDYVPMAGGREGR